MCWAHMRRNVNKKLSIVKNKETTQEILDDIDQLQLCESEKVFRNYNQIMIGYNLILIDYNLIIISEKIGF